MSSKIGKEKAPSFLLPNFLLPKYLITIGLFFGISSYSGAAPRLDKNNTKNAMGTLKVFPFADKTQSLTCVAAHIGNGLMLTSGHCFLGAHHCNGSYVELNDGSLKKAKHPCTAIRSIATTQSRFNPSGLDYALFQVSPTPRGVFAFDPQGLHMPASESIETYSCGAVDRLLKDFFGRLRKGTTYVGSCNSDGLPHGFPIFSSNGAQIIGLVQGNFDAPTKTLETLTYISPLPTEFPALSNSAVSGEFASESFPNGIGGGFDFVLKEYNEEGPITLRFSRSASTKMWIKEGTGIEYHFEGSPSLAESKAQTFQQPVQIRILTGTREPGLFSFVTALDY